MYFLTYLTFWSDRKAATYGSLYHLLFLSNKEIHNPYNRHSLSFPNDLITLPVHYVFETAASSPYRITTSTRIYPPWNNYRREINPDDSLFYNNLNNEKSFYLYNTAEIKPDDLYSSDRAPPSHRLPLYSTHSVEIKLPVHCLHGYKRAGLKCPYHPYQKKATRLMFERRSYKIEESLEPDRL